MSDESHSPEEQPQVVNLSGVDVGTVHAGLVRMHQSSAEEIHAEDLELSQSLALEVNAANAQARQSGLVFTQADVLSVESGIVGAARANSISINGGVGLAAAERVEFGNAYAGVVAGREVRSEKIETLLLLSSKVEGNVFTVMDTRGALIAGLVGGLFTGLALLLGRALFGRK